jgi:isoquinoline 1-oxidoreductase beta subunit
MTGINISRRSLLRSGLAAGGGLMIGFHLPGSVFAEVISADPTIAPAEGLEINAWLTIDPDGIVMVRVPHSEQGQGALTSVSSMIAEELDVPWKDVRVVFADPNRHVNQGKEYVTMSTSGSNLVRNRHPHIMQAGASARERLKEAAAQAWGVDRSAVTARQGKLSSGKFNGTYGEFATAAAGVTLDKEPEIKAYGDWWLLGTEVPRVDVAVKSNGSAKFSIDVDIDGMVYAAVKACPVPWGRLISFNADAVKNRPGIIAVIELKSVEGRTGINAMQNGVAVVADSYYRAKTALDLLPIEWDFGTYADTDNQSLNVQAQERLSRTGEVSHSEGDDPLPMIAAASPDRVVNAEFFRPYEAHARMEPVNATVSVTADRVDVWAPSQDQALLLATAADQAGVSTEKVFVHTMFIGGAFGGGGSGNTAVTRQATELSKQLRRPVKVIWSREEDIGQGKQRPINWSRFSAAIGSDGLPTAWFTRSIGEPNRPDNADRAISNMPYKVPNRRHERNTVDSHIPTASHRAPGNNQNGFMIEQFVDEVALAGGWDPLEWRIKMTEGMEPWQRVLLKLKEVSGFTTDLPRGEGMGIAVVEDHATFCAVCATVTVSRRGELRVEKMVVVVNSGYIINPLNCREQVNGSVCWELSHALYGGLNLQNGRFVNTNFDKYGLMRIHDSPEIETHFALSKAGWWGGMGEPAGPPSPPAVANAIYFATGKRIRTTPIMEQDLSWS